MFESHFREIMVQEAEFPAFQFGEIAILRQLRMLQQNPEHGFAGKFLPVAVLRKLRLPEEQLLPFVIAEVFPAAALRRQFRMFRQKNTPQLSGEFCRICILKQFVVDKVVVPDIEENRIVTSAGQAVPVAFPRKLRLPVEQNAPGVVIESREIEPRLQLRLFGKNLGLIFRSKQFCRTEFQ